MSESPAATVIVELVNGPLDGNESRFDKPLITIGSDRSCDVSIPWDEQVAANHCQIEVRGQELVVKVQQSDQPTIVDGEEIEAEAVLTDESILRIGNSEIACRFDSDIPITESIGIRSASSIDFGSSS